ncbi:MAG TPA: hypothetical protein VMZ22_08505 [Acidimicrobiales bacterium]|nr:hypothetical protein [Acidimicrobiales bacterium]
MTILQLHESVTRFTGLTDATASRLGVLDDEQLTALSVLAAPEAIAVVTRHEFGTSITHVIATRGPWLAEHVVEGDAHHLHAGDADHAALRLLDRSGFLEPDIDVSLALGRAVDVTLGALRRASELAFAGDRRRARAALLAEGAPAIDAHELADALARGRVEVAGLAADGRRFIGCDLATVGDAHTGRWLVPTSAHAEAPLGARFRHPSYAGSLRALVERVGADKLRDEVALVFGEV